MQMTLGGEGSSANGGDVSSVQELPALIAALVRSSASLASAVPASLTASAPPDAAHRPLQSPEMVVEPGPSPVEPRVAPRRIFTTSDLAMSRKAAARAFGDGEGLRAWRAAKKAADGDDGKRAKGPAGL